MKWTIMTTRGWKYRGPHSFGSAKACLEYLRKRFADSEMKFDWPVKDDDSSATVITNLCGNPATVANLIAED